MGYKIKKNNMDGSDPLQIDIGKVLSDKSPGVAKILPGFLINYLRKIVHEKELNDFFRDYGTLHNVDFVKAGVTYLGINYKVHRKEVLPLTGRNIFVSNHPLGGFDGMIFLLELSKYYDNIKFPVNDILMNVKNMEGVFIAINKHGAQARDAALALEEAYASDDQILYFPAGLCSRKKKGKICDLTWHKSFISKAIKHKRTIVPVYFSGRNSEFFYRLSNFRSIFGIKTNFEMFYLVDEMFKQRGKQIDLVFGKGFSWETFDKSKTPLEWADWLKEKSYELAGYIPE